MLLFLSLKDRSLVDVEEKKGNHPLWAKDISGTTTVISLKN